MTGPRGGPGPAARIKVVILDGQGGGLGRTLVEMLRRHPLVQTRADRLALLAVGTNALATSAMLKAGADAGATGENAIIWNCADADLVCGPLGIVLSGALHGEVSAAMSRAVAESRARKILVPSIQCQVRIAGVADRSPSQYAEEAVAMAAEWIVERLG